MKQIHVQITEEARSGITKPQTARLKHYSVNPNLLLPNAELDSAEHKHLSKRHAHSSRPPLYASNLYNDRAWPGKDHLDRADAVNSRQNIRVLDPRHLLIQGPLSMDTRT